MLKHMIYTSVALAIASTSLAANAVDNNFTNQIIPPANSSAQPNHNNQPAKKIPNTPSVPSVPSSPMQPAKKIPNTPSVPSVPSSPMQPAKKIPNTPSVPKYPMQPTKTLPVYEGLEMGYHGNINVDIQRCLLMRGSHTPDMIRFDNAFFSTDNGSKVTLDPYGDAKSVYHFSNENEVYTKDLDQIIVNRFISIGKSYSRVVMRTANVTDSDNGMRPIWSTYQFDCSNSNVHFDMK
ncbi:hypothetical protein SOPP22_09610 [Shewanella sp. OPT22]|nr:hypothetical protein SOPP22_09610 [Shewanella sp. OPT22]